MTSNFPGTVDAQHGLKTDKHAEPTVEDERPARSRKAGRACRPSYHQQHTTIPGEDTEEIDRHCHSRLVVTGHFPQTREEVWLAVKRCIKQQYLGCHNGAPCFHTLQKAPPRTGSESASVSETSHARKWTKIRFSLSVHGLSLCRWWVEVMVWQCDVTLYRAIRVRKDTVQSSNPWCV